MPHTDTGPGTWAAKDQNVKWDLLRKRNESCVAPEHILRMPSNAVLLMKGNKWPGIEGNGLTHKSPGWYSDRNATRPKRLILKVDLNETLGFAA